MTTLGMERPGAIPTPPAHERKDMVTGMNDLKPGLKKVCKDVNCDLLRLPHDLASGPEPRNQGEGLVVSPGQALGTVGGLLF